MSTQETGHKKNLTHLELMITYCEGYGTKYNPTNPLLKILALKALYSNTKISFKIVDDKLTPYSYAVDRREEAFEPLNTLSTQISNALKSAEVSKKTVEDAETFIRKIKGKRATSNKKGGHALDSFIDSTHETTTEVQPVTSSTPEDKEISATQLGYDNKVEHLAKLVSLLLAEPAYAPNEEELQSATLQTLHDKLDTLNTNVINTIAPLSNARMERNKLLYGDNTGIYDIQKKVKEYVKSVFKVNSPEYKQISKIRFTKPH